MTTSNLQAKLLEVKHFIPDNKKLQHGFKLIEELIIEANQDNIEAMCPAVKIDTKTYDICDEVWGDDYEVITGSYNFEIDGEEFSVTSYERDTMIEDLNAEYEVLSDSSYTNSKKYRDSRKIKEKIKIIETADYEADEIYYNTAWAFWGDQADCDIAKLVGLGVLERNSDEQTFLFLQGCGQDNTPTIMAYQALKYGYIDTEYLSKLRDIDWVKYVMGKKLFAEVMEELGIAHLVEVTDKKARERMTQFNKKIESLSKLKAEGGDSLLVGILGVQAVLEAK